MIRRNLFISKLRRRLCEKGMLALGAGGKFETGKSKFYSNVLGIGAVHRCVLLVGN